MRGIDVTFPATAFHAGWSRREGVAARVRLHQGVRVGCWFWWGHVSSADVDTVASEAGLVVTECWNNREDRWFAALARD